MATRSIVPRANNEGGVGTTSKKWANVWATLVNALTLTAQSVGFTISGGTTSKTLTVDEDVTMSAKANLASPAFTGTPAAPAPADNTSTTQLATTAFAKSQDSVLARLPDQAVNMTAATGAGVTTALSVASNANLNFGTGNCSIACKVSLVDWSVNDQKILYHDDISSIGWQLINGNWSVPSRKLSFWARSLGAIYSSTIEQSFVNGTEHLIVLSIINNSTLLFYVDGVQFGDSVTIGSINLSPTAPLEILGSVLGQVRTAGTCSFAATYNRALTAAEVLDLYRNGIAFADKYGSQTAQTSGTLTIGKRYRIDNWITNDDFTNVGGANVDGTEFIATGTTPTTWTNSSTVYPIGATLALEPEGIQNDKWYDSSTNALNASYPAAGSSLMRKLNVPRTNTAQPAFLVIPTTAQNNLAIDSTVDIILGTEIFDRTNDFASNIFTAPITGLYFLSFFARLDNIDSAATAYALSIITSNRNYHVTIDPTKFSADLVYLPIGFSVISDMDAGDTAKIRFYQTGGTQQTDLATDSFFSGFLAC